MKVICLGLPRTGTSSLAKALELLFKNTKTLHGVKLAQTITDYDIENINNFLNGNFKNYSSYMNNYNFILDIPSILFLDKSVETFKDDKFIFTYRNSKDFAESWSKYMKLSFTIVKNNKYKNILESGNSLFFDSMDLFDKCRSHKFKFSKYSLQEAIFDTQIGEALYNDYENYVKQIFKNKNILFLNINDGWTPLCEFLKIDVPKEDFPHTNKLEDHRKNVELFHEKFIQ
uniref:Sulfotransferase domain-containing protein n=1 Tax=viral metagenome TaxID=1070528 RepID=A0A6C0J813_9ZZZZ